jgi:DNA replication protein DnaC
MIRRSSLERRMIERRIREARFPTVKSLDSFDFADVALLDRPGPPLH